MNGDSYGPYNDSELEGGIYADGAGGETGGSCCSQGDDRVISELDAGLSTVGLGSAGDFAGSEAGLGGSDNGLGGRSSSMSLESSGELIGGCHSLDEALTGNSSLLVLVLGEPEEGWTA